jgi:hypothetical protein
MVAQLDYLAVQRQLDELLPAAPPSQLEPVPTVQALPVRRRRRSVDATVVLGATCIASWTVVATEIVLLVR